MQIPLGTVVLGKYRVEELVGEGAFAQVYRVTRLDLNAIRAMKVLPANAPNLGSEGFNDYRQRYRREGRIAAQLDHPNVTKVYDQGEGGSFLYLILEYAPGGSIADLIKKEGPLPFERVVQILSDCATGLEALHEKAKAIHRDVKPQNILLGADGHAIIADLGSAQVDAGSFSLRTRLGSQVPSHPGTSGYLSPEHKKPDPLLPTSDVYSLGCVAFEMLTGRAWQSVTYKADCVCDLRPDVPEWLDKVVMRMLSPNPGLDKADADDPNKRYVTMTAVRDALQNGPPPSTPQGKAGAGGVSSILHRKSLGITALVVGGLILLLCLGLAMQQISGLPSPTPIAIAAINPIQTTTPVNIPSFNSTGELSAAATVGPSMTATWTATPSPSPTSTATSTARPTASPTSTATLVPPTPTNSNVCRVATLVDPPNGANKVKETVLQWKWDSELKSDEVFDVLVWPESDPVASIGTTRETKFYIDFAHWNYSGKLGRFWWTVCVKRGGSGLPSDIPVKFLLIVNEPPPKWSTPGAALPGAPSTFQVVGTGGLLGLGMILGLTILSELPIRLPGRIRRK